MKLAIYAIVAATGFYSGEHFTMEKHYTAGYAAGQREKPNDMQCVAWWFGKQGSRAFDYRRKVCGEKGKK